jgi:hypothetical protein
MLATTSFSPMNPGVTVVRPYPKKPVCIEDTSRPAPNIEALITTSTSCSPANPSATLPRMLALNDIGSHPPGSRSRLLEDIPSIVKRFDVPKANVLTRFPDAPHPHSSSKRPEPNQDPATYQFIKTVQTNLLTENTEKSPKNETVVKTETKTRAIVADPRPGFSRLPSFLHPREGTTYNCKFATGQETKVAGKLNTFQYILYGHPNPGAKVDTAATVVEKHTLLQSIWYGVPDDNSEKMVKVAAHAETVAETKVVGDQKEEAVVVKQVEKNVGSSGSSDAAEGRNGG